MPGPPYGEFFPIEDITVPGYGTLKKNQIIAFDDPCEAAGFVNAAIASGNGFQENAIAEVDRIERDCSRQRGEIVITVTPAPYEVQDPSTTAPDEAPSAEAPTSEQLGAPSPNATLNGTPKLKVPGESDGRTLQEQYYDPDSPILDYDLPPILLSDGVPEEQLDEEVTRIIQNDPPRREPHPFFGQDNTLEPLSVVDPVDVFTGQYMLTVTDVQIPSRGFPLLLTRLYRSGEVYFGPWGYNWDHNYNVYLRELNDGGAAIWTGRLSEDVYKPAPDGGFEPPTGVFLKLERQAATPLHPDRYVLISHEGLQHIFERPIGWPRPDRLPLVRIEDRHDNTHHLRYDAEGRLERVEDHAGRFIRFIYGDCGLLEQVTDHTERVWRYFHDANVEHLIAVMTPATPEYPEGLTTCYEYDRFRTHPALLHNLTKVIDPAGRVVVENRYGDEPDTDDFGRVLYQEFGGFEAIFHATRLQYVPRTPEAINVPALRVEVVDPGVLHVYTFNYRGDLLDERFRLASDGSYRLAAWTYRYDEQGNLIEQREPNGLGVIAEYDYENTDPRARGNLIRLSLSAPPTRPAPGRQIARYSYEPRYQRLKTVTVRDETGAITITTFVYDYEITNVDHGDVVRIDRPPTTLPDGSIQTSSEHFNYNDFGELREYRSGEGRTFTYEYYEAGPASGYLRRAIAGVGVENQSQEFGYDSYGNLNRAAQTPEAVTEYEYNALGQLMRVRSPMVAGARGEVAYHYGRDGRLQSQDMPRGAYQDGVIADPFIRDEFEFDALGHVRSLIQGANTATPRRWRIERNAEGFPTEIEDPLGRVMRVQYDERNLPLRQILFVGSTEERSLRFSYDRNGNLTRLIDPAGRTQDYHYDAWDRLTEIEFPGQEGMRTRMTYHYGVRDQLDHMEVIGVPRPNEMPALLAEMSQGFDELGRLVRRTQGLVSTTFWHDRDSYLVRAVDQRGYATNFTCDSLGRVRLVTDALGNQVTYTYDGLDNVASVDESEVVPGAEPSAYHTTLRYDARKRLTGLIDPLGNILTAEYDDRDLLVVTTSPLGIRTEYEYDLEGQWILARGFVGDPAVPVEHRWRRDLAGRVKAYIDPEGQETHYQYNAEDRWTQIILPDGSVRQRIFDTAGQLEREIAPTGTVTKFDYGPDGLVEQMRFTAPPPIIELADLQYERDGLGRPVRLSQGATTLELAYDLLGRLVSETAGGSVVRWTFDDLNGWANLTYPDGRVDRYQQDALGRPSNIILQQSADEPLTGLLSGALLASYEYAGPLRLHRRILGNGCETRYTYDQGRRLTGIEHLAADGGLLALAQYVYDADGRRRVLRSEPAPGASALFKYDTLSRLSKVSEGFAAPLPPVDMDQANADAYVVNLGIPPAQRTYEYILNRADARTLAVLTEAAGTTTETYTSNNLNQITQLTRTTPAGEFTLPFTYDLDGRRTSDHRFTYRYDALGRLREVWDLPGVTRLLSQEFDPLGRVIRRELQDGVSERFHYSGLRSIQDDTSNGIALRQRCFGIHLDELIAQSDGADRWAHQDARLSLLAVSDGSGAPLERYNYTPFGIPAIWAADGATSQAASSTGMRPLFGGHRTLGLSAVYDARARVYDADTACFLQRDPRGYVNSPDLYVYVSQNPVNLVDPSGEVVPIVIAVGVIVGAVAAIGYSFYDAYHHPERYGEGFSWRAMLQTFGGAAVGGVSALAGEAVLASAGMGSLAAGSSAAEAGTLSIGQTLVASGTVSAFAGWVDRIGFQAMFPDYVDAPSAGTVVNDFVVGAGLGLGVRALEAIGSPFSREGRWTIRLNVREAYLRARIWYLTKEPYEMPYPNDRAIAATVGQLERQIAVGRIARTLTSELRAINLRPGPFAYSRNPEFDILTTRRVIQVKVSQTPGTGANFGGRAYQVNYTAQWGRLQGLRAQYYMEPPLSKGILRELQGRGISEPPGSVTPPLRGTVPFPLPFRGALGVLPWFLVFPREGSPGGGPSTIK